MTTLIPPLPPGEGRARARHSQGDRLRLETAVRSVENNLLRSGYGLQTDTIP
jgi:hypothetical protein